MSIGGVECTNMLKSPLALEFIDEVLALVDCALNPILQLQHVRLLSGPRRRLLRLLRLKGSIVYHERTVLAHQLLRLVLQDHEKIFEIAVIRFLHLLVLLLLQGLILLQWHAPAYLLGQVLFELLEHTLFLLQVTQNVLAERRGIQALYFGIGAISEDLLGGAVVEGYAVVSLFDALLLVADVEGFGRVDVSQFTLDFVYL